ncbi:MAG: hypothetical protein H5T86_04310, partial [Armatimonadetes bacterium]|nr:hypothetical protein [Armatimonadota bacterium]
MAGIDERRIVDQLVQMGILDDAVVEQIRGAAEEQGIGLIQALISSGVVTADDIARAVEAVGPVEEAESETAEPSSGQATPVAVPSRRVRRPGRSALDTYEVSLDAVAAVPRSLADEYCVLPLQISQDRILVAMPDASNVFALDAIRDHTGRRVEAIEVDQAELRRAIDHYYAELARQRIKLTAGAKDISASVQQQEIGAVVDREFLQVLDQAPVVRIVEQLITDAVRMNASDIHIEPRADRVQVRFRIDGRLTTHANLPKSMQQAVIS